MIVQFGSKMISLDLAVICTLDELMHILEKETNIPSTNIKLIANGKVLQTDISFLEFKDSNASKILMTGSVSNLENIRQPKIKDDLTEDGLSHRRKYAVTLSDIKSQNKISIYCFREIRTIPGLPSEHQARKILHDLANDPGVLAVLEKYKWSVGALCELYPEGYVGVSDVCVMGLNENKGQRILLRLRTDDLKGFRKILSIKKVLCHELSHNVHSDHDDKFYVLMRQIERDVVDLNWKLSSSRALSAGRDDVYSYSDRADGPSTGERTDSVSVLGGGSRFIGNAVDAARLAALARAEATKMDVDEVGEVHVGDVEGGGDEEDDPRSCGCSMQHVSQAYMPATICEVVEGVSSPSSSHQPVGGRGFESGTEATSSVLWEGGGEGEGGGGARLQVADAGERGVVTPEVAGVCAGRGESGLGEGEDPSAHICDSNTGGKHCRDRDCDVVATAESVSLSCPLVSLGSTYMQRVDDMLAMYSSVCDTDVVPDRVLAFRSHLQILCLGLDDDDLRETVKMVSNVIRNAIKDSNKRSINVSNKTFQRVVTDRQAIPLLTAAGFTPQSDLSPPRPRPPPGPSLLPTPHLVLAHVDQALLYMLQSVLDAMDDCTHS